MKCPFRVQNLLMPLLLWRQRLASLLLLRLERPVSALSPIFRPPFELER